MNGLTATWISGAKQHIPARNLILDRVLLTGGDESYTVDVIRDQSAPGAAEDAQYGAQLQQAAAQQAQESLEQEQENQDALAAALAVYAQSIARAPQPAQTECNSEQIFNEIHTTCR